MNPVLATYRFDVQGRAVPQGSKRAFVQNGRAIMTEQTGSRHKSWRDLVTLIAQNTDTRPPTPIEGPVAVSLLFRFARPKAHYYQRQSGPVLRQDAPLFVYSRAIGDIDKLQRSVFDSLVNAGWIRDDSQIVRIEATKTWTHDADSVTVSMDEIQPVIGTTVENQGAA